MHLYVVAKILRNNIDVGGTLWRLGRVAVVVVVLLLHDDSWSVTVGLITLRCGINGTTVDRNHELVRAMIDDHKLKPSLFPHIPACTENDDGDQVQDSLQGLHTTSLNERLKQLYHQILFCQIKKRRPAVQDGAC